MRSWRFVTGLLVLTLAGCRTPSAPRASAAPPPPVLLTVGHVLHVNAPRGYAVLQCGSLPSPGEEARVFRGEQPVARLRISGPNRPPFVTADILDGQPLEGDAVKVFRQRGAAAPSEVKKP